MQCCLNTAACNTTAETGELTTCTLPQDEVTHVTNWHNYTQSLVTANSCLTDMGSCSMTTPVTALLVAFHNTVTESIQNGESPASRYLRSTQAFSQKCVLESLKETGSIYAGDSDVQALSIAASTYEDVPGLAADPSSC